MRFDSVRMFVFMFIVLACTATHAQKKISCPDGDHYEINVREIAIQYDGSTFGGTLSSLNIVSGLRIAVDPKKLQDAAAATQEWNEYLKGLVVGYNTCAITKAQYNEGLQKFYPQLKNDTNELDKIRQSIVEGRKIDDRRLQNLVDNYLVHMRGFAEIAGKLDLLEEVLAASEKNLVVSERTEKNTQTLLEQFAELRQQIIAQSGSSPTSDFSLRGIRAYLYLPKGKMMLAGNPQLPEIRTGGIWSEGEGRDSTTILIAPSYPRGSIFAADAPSVIANLSVWSFAPGPLDFLSLKGEVSSALVHRVVVRGLHQNIAKISWSSVTFEDCIIRYHGEPLSLADVRFRNCKFDFGQDPTSQAVLAAIESRGEQPVSIVEGANR